MEIDLTSKSFRAVSAKVDEQLKNGFSWEDIREMKYLEDNENFDDKCEFLASLSPDIDEEYYKKVVDILLEEEENGIDIYVRPSSSFIPGNVDSKPSLPAVRRGSAFEHYIQVLRNKNFSHEAINEIINSANRSLQKLVLDHNEQDNVKGLVVGNVQSGKTANMAALIAMAADKGFNMFIVMTGTIENLRKQNQQRLLDDLSSGGNQNLKWINIDRPSANCELKYKLRQLNLNDHNPNRYISICLKNSTRLSQLLQWMNGDKNNRQKIKLLIIDDESDQGGINTNAFETQEDVENEKKERTAINRLIVDLVNNRTDTDEKAVSQMKAINYVMYTATPYANVLNENPGKDSLFPSDFVSCLKPGEEYIGPQHIFGLENIGIDGLNIINEISSNDIKCIKKIHDGTSNNLPKSLKSAILWFYCCFAMFKKRNIKKPISMLVHTSQRQKHHELLARAITEWITNYDPNEFIKECEKVFEIETNMLSIDDFKAMFSKYDEDKIRKYPLFEEIKDSLKEIVNEKIRSILIDQDGELDFNKGVNLCIDNCSAQSKAADNEHIRLIYPKNGQVDYTTGFIVIGGATLSRGLTIEGLTTSYFLRTVKTADTLMQMGRWFGYRVGYELLPRLWLSNKTKEQFKFLSEMDYDLRKTLKELESYEIKPALVGIKIMTNPKISFLNVTSKNKQHAAVTRAISYGGIATQTTMFTNKEDVLAHNYEETIKFVNSLGCDNEIDNSANKFFNKNSHLWKHVSYKKIISFLDNIQFPKENIAFPNIKFLRKWYEEVGEPNNIDEFNVLIAGSDIESSNEIQFGDYKVNTVNRSRKKIGEDNLIKIGALRNMKDFYADIDISNVNFCNEDKLFFNHKSSKMFKLVRAHAGLQKTSLLVIYIIDKNSKPRVNEKNRFEMNTQNHIVGFGLIIPDSNDHERDKNYISIDPSTISYNPLEGGDNE